MKFRTKKVLSGILAAAMTFSSVSFAAVAATAPILAVAAETSGVTITEAKGWFESVYTEWAPVSGAAQYKAYVKGSNGAYTQLDDPLIRSYSTYWRADAVGLKAGTYSMKIEALDSSGKVIATAEKNGLTASAYDRSGSAFSKNSKFGSSSGAYNDDGTLKSTAQVVYITPETAKTVKADVISDAKGKMTTYTGFQNIIYGLQKGYDKRGFDFRIVGCIDADDMDAFGSSAEGLQVKGKAAYSEMNMTIEGIGEDATIKNFGILIRNAANIEIRNFAIMLCMDDSLSLDTSNANIWVHNMDCYYGSTGGDADQAKGDGTMDVKGGSTYVTFAYNHFWDNGKSSLCGMKSEDTSSFITYHHNWFDHSDSRHPRIRTMSVHVYNNYFDSCAKYGVGMTMGGSAFVENNYFLDVTKPMMISCQGTDKSGAGTFSGEAGGVIKSYNNKFAFNKINSSKLTYVTQKNSATSFDAVEVGSRTETVPSSYKALSGGTTYNNFDTNWDLGVKTLDAVESVPSVVTSNAGRMNGGDFPNDRTKYSIINDAASYSVDTAFKNSMAAYVSPVLSIGGTVKGAVISQTTTKKETTTQTTTKATTQTTTKATTQTTTKKETTTQTTTKATTQTTTKKETTTQTTTASASGTVAMGSYALNSSTIKNNALNNMTFNARSIDSTGVKLRSDNSITFKTSQACQMTVEVSGKDILVDGATVKAGTSTVSLKAGTHTITGSASGSNSTLTKITFAASSTQTTTKKETTTQATTKATTQTTTKQTTTKKETTTQATTKATSSSKSLSFGSSSVTVAPGSSATIKINASSPYYIEQTGASWWFESDFLNVWGSNSDKSLTASSQSFTINQWAGVTSGHTVTLTAHLASDPSVTATMKVVIK